MALISKLNTLNNNNKQQNIVDVIKPNLKTITYK